MLARNYKNKKERIKTNENNNFSGETYGAHSLDTQKKRNQIQEKADQARVT
jgi:hypothetical protein